MIKTFENLQKKKKKKKKVNFAVSVDQSENQRKRKEKDKYSDLARELRMLRNMMVAVMVISALGTVHKRLRKGGWKS